jgi:hypothetical protein
MSRWIACEDDRPDEDMIVIVYAPAQNDPVWLGYHDGDRWLSVDGTELDVSHWQDLPEPPDAEEESAPERPLWRDYSRALPKRRRA